MAMKLVETTGARHRNCHLRHAGTVQHNAQRKAISRRHRDWRQRRETLVKHFLSTLCQTAQLYSQFFAQVSSPGHSGVHLTLEGINNIGMLGKQLAASCC